MCVFGSFGTLAILSALEGSVLLYHAGLAFININSHIGVEILTLFFSHLYRGNTQYQI